MRAAGRVNNLLLWVAGLEHNTHTRALALLGSPRCAPLRPKPATALHGADEGNRGAVEATRKQAAARRSVPYSVVRVRESTDGDPQLPPATPGGPRRSTVVNGN